MKKCKAIKFWPVSEKKSFSRIKELKRLLVKQYSPRKLIPKPIRMMGRVKKAVASWQKHRGVYSAGVSALLHSGKKYLK